MSENNQPRAVEFEAFKRNNPEVIPLASAWRNTPEYEAWMGIFTTDDENKVQYFEESSGKIGTFYRFVTEAEKRASENKPEPEPEESKEKKVPQFEVLSVPHQHEDDDGTKHSVTHVKLGRPRWTRAGDSFALCEYVLVDLFEMPVEGDPNQDIPSFTFVRSEVLISDETGASYEDIDPLYAANTKLDLWEAMWALGEINITEEN